MRVNFFKLSGFVLAVALVAVAAVSGTSAQARPRAQATMAATMAGGNMATMAGSSMATMAGTMSGAMMGAFPPCPVAMGPMATMSGTMSSMMTMAPTMAGTMAMAMTMAPTMAGTMAMAAAPVVGPYVANNGCELVATLSGADEKPKAADANGKGTADIFITRPASGPGQVCFQLTATGIKLPAAAAHIHKGAADVAGPVVVTLAPPDASGKSSGCASGVDADLIEQLLTEPLSYYVNIHNADFPAGAMRGQLGVK